MIDSQNNGERHCVDARGGDDDYACGQWTGFACIDPSADCVDDDGITAEMVSTAKIPSRLGWVLRTGK